MRWPLRPLLTLCAALLVGTGCRVGATGVPGQPGARVAAPRAIPASVRDARRRLRAYDTEGALRQLEAGRALSAAEPERTWLLVHLWRARGHGDRARAEAALLEAGPFRAAVEASLAEDGARGLRDLLRWRGRGGGPWVSLAEAYLRAAAGDAEGAAGAAARVVSCGVVFIEVEARLVRARAALEAGDLDRAVADAREAARRAPTDVRAYGIAAVAARRNHEWEEAARNLLAGAREAPESEGYPRALADLIRRAEDDTLRASIGAGCPTRPGSGNGEWRALHGLMAEEGGRAEEAIALYAAALSRGADPIPVERDLRRLLIQRGAYRRATSLLLEAVPPGVRDDPANLRSEAWRDLTTAVQQAPDHGAPVPARRALAVALVAVGALAEARAVLARLPEDGAARALDARLAAHLAFEQALETLLEGGYRTGSRKDEAPDFEAILPGIVELARRHLPADEAAAFARGGEGLRRVPVLATWLDHGTDTTSPIVRHFRRYGRFVVLGERAGQPPEAVLLSLAGLYRGVEIRTRGHRLRQDLAIGYDRHLRSFLTSQDVELGGACLPDGIWLDADAARRAEHGLRSIWRVDPGGRRMALERDDRVAADTPEGIFALGEPAGVAMRLLARYVERRPRDGWGSYRTLRAHECGHLVEIRRHLPIVAGLPCTLALLAERAFCPTGVESELEMRAQLAAVAESEDPDLALAEMLLDLPVTERDPEPHEGGYRDGVLRLLRHLAAHPERYPVLDRRYRLLPQLHRLSDADIRRAARAVLPR